MHPTTAEDESFIRQSYAVAQEAVAHGNHPFGAVLVLDGRVVLRAENNVCSAKDPTGHAETNLMRLAGKELSEDERRRSILYTSTEPCIMCCGAIYWASVRKIRFGFPEEGLRELTGAANLANPTLLVPCRTSLASVIDQFEIVGPILPDEGRRVHANFWDRYKSE